MAFRRNHVMRERAPRKEQRFLSAGLLEMPMRGMLRDGAPVRFQLTRAFGYPDGKYRGYVTAVGQSIYDDKGFVRIIVTKPPADASWVKGRPVYVVNAKLKLLPSKKRARVFNG